MTDSRIRTEKDTKEERKCMAYVFGFMEQSLHDMYCCAVGFVRNTAQIIFRSLVYNMLR